MDPQQTKVVQYLESYKTAFLEEDYRTCSALLAQIKDIQAQKEAQLGPKLPHPAHNVKAPEDGETGLSDADYNELLQHLGITKEELLQAQKELPELGTFLKDREEAKQQHEEQEEHAKDENDEEDEATEEDENDEDYEESEEDEEDEEYEEELEIQQPVRRSSRISSLNARQ